MADEKKEKEYRLEDYDDESYKKKLPKDPKPDLSWVEEEERERKKKQKAAAAAQSKALESSSGGGVGHGGAENSGGSSASGGKSQNANAQGGAGAGGGAHGHGGGGGGWGGGGKGKSSGSNVVVAEPDSPAHAQSPLHEHHHHDHHPGHHQEDRSPLPAKKPLAYKLKDADPLSGIYSDRMKAKIKIEAAKGASESARDTEILKLASPISSDDRWLIEKSFSPQFLKSKLNAGHTLPSSIYQRSFIDQRIAELSREKALSENLNQVAAKSFSDHGNDRTKDLPSLAHGADESSKVASSAPAAPAPVKARDGGGGREM